MSVQLYSPTAFLLSSLSAGDCTRRLYATGMEANARRASSNDGIPAEFGSRKWVEITCLEWDRSWKKNRSLPQYKYLAIPTYKFVASKTNSVFGAVASFFVTDLIMHQLLPQIAINLTCIALKTATGFPSQIICSQISWYPLISIGWLLVGMPGIYSKYIQDKHK